MGKLFEKVSPNPFKNSRKREFFLISDKPYDFIGEAISLPP